MDALRIEEVAVRLNVSVGTLNRWYKFKRENPKSEISKKLPNYSTVKTLRGTARVWTTDDLLQLAQFKVDVKSGRAGQMGKYKGRGTKNGKNKNRKGADA